MTLRASLDLQTYRSIELMGDTDHEARIAELEALQRIGRALNSTLDEKEILRLLIEVTVTATLATQGSVFLHDPQRGIRLPQVWYGYTPEQIKNLENVGRFVQRGIINRVFDTGKIAVTDDVRQDPDYVAVVSETCSELTVPIRYGDEVVGVLDLESPQVGAFGPDTQHFVLTIAEQAAIAIGNARRYAEQVGRESVVSQRNEQLRKLLEISSMFRSEHTLDDLLDLIVQSIPETLGFNIALLSLLEGDPPRLRRVAAAGLPLADFIALQQTLPPLETFERLLTDKYRISQSYFFSHQELDEWNDEYTHIVLEDVGEWQEGGWHPQDMLLVPLKDSHGKMLGLLSVDDPQDGRVPTPDTIRSLELHAHEASLAIENARLLDQTRQHVEELELLQQVGLEAASSLDLKTVLDSIAASALQLVPASDVRIYLYDQRTGRFDCGTQKSHGVQSPRPMTPPRKDGFTVQVVQKGQVLVINDAKHHNLYTRPESSHWGMHAIAGFPLKRAGEILGVMDVSFFYEHTFTQKELDLLNLLANQVTVAIDNARLYEHAKRRAAHLEALWHINQRLASIRDFDELLSQVVGIIENYFDYNDIGIYLVNQSNNQLVLQARSGQDMSMPGKVKNEIPLNQPDSVISWVATHRQPLLLGSSDSGAIPGLTAMIKLPDTGSELAVPLYMDGQVAGVLNIHGSQANVLTQEDVSVIQALSAQLSVAFENARLYDELELRVYKRTEELADALKRQALEADKTRAIVESISDAVIVFDPQGNVVLANPGTGRVFGVSHHFWMQRNLNDDKLDRGELPADLSMRDCETILSVFQQTRLAREALSGGQELVNAIFEAPGRVIAASFASVALRGPEPLNVVAVFRDITREAQVDRMKSEFIGVAAHELRTPMTAIQGYVGLLSAGLPGPINETQHHFLDIVNSNVDRLMTLVRDLLDLSKMEGEGLRLHLNPESVADIVAEAVFTLQKQIEAKEQTLSVDVPPGLPEIMADRDRLIQVVTNLLSNAHKYTPRGGRLVVHGWQSNGHLRLDFQDTGIGISSQDQERLFTRFFRADNAVQTEEGGTGLGLAICNEIVRRHQGEIQVKSELGQGSTFTVILPLAETTSKLA